MRLHVDPGQALPMYAQLEEQLRQAIALGELSPGDRLPTVRQLAVDLRINANTVSRAYSELERAGLIATRQGRGTFVSEAPPSPRSADRAAQLGRIIEAALAQAAAIGCTPREFAKAVREHVR